jgi:hypothetical protein
MSKRAQALAKHKAGAFVALIAVLLQAFLFAAVAPQAAMAGSHNSPYLAQSICGVPPATQPGSHNSPHTLPDCRLCPLCLSVLAGGVGLPPPAPALPLRFATAILRSSAHSILPGGARVEQAAQPRGPPPTLQNS